MPSGFEYLNPSGMKIPPDKHHSVKLQLSESWNLASRPKKPELELGIKPKKTRVRTWHQAKKTRVGTWHQGKKTKLILASRQKNEADLGIKAKKKKVGT